MLAATFSTVHRSTQTKNHAALPLARLDLTQSAKNWYKISQHSITGIFLSQPFVFACASLYRLFFSTKEKSNKQQTSDWSDRRGGEIY